MPFKVRQMTPRLEGSLYFVWYFIYSKFHEEAKFANETSTFAQNWLTAKTTTFTVLQSLPKIHAINICRFRLGNTNIPVVVGR